MRVLIVYSGTQGVIRPFIKEQIESLEILGVEISLFPIKKKGFIGYLLHLMPLLKSIKKVKPDLIHAHYGLSGLLANLQRNIPVITSFHGSDINSSNALKYSKWAHRLSAASIFVGNSMMQKIKKHNWSVVIPCGVDISIFYPIPKQEASRKMDINTENLNILFSSSFNNPVKNYQLAMRSCEMVSSGGRLNLIELKGFNRDQVNLLMNASDCVLLTSFSEGSSQFIKEAMACNCPIVSTDVGDVKWVAGHTPGCFISSFSPNDIAKKIKLAIEFRKNHGQTRGRERINELGLDSVNIARKIYSLYNEVMKS
jgi:glycosyltransferase involved in cell wall biosynthesis